MAGVKTLINRSSAPLRVTLIGREGENPGLSLYFQASVYIQPGQTLHEVRYGDDRNPYLGGMSIEHANQSSMIGQTMAIFQRGDVGTLDHKMNSNSVFEINYDDNTSCFSFIAHN